MSHFTKIDQLFVHRKAFQAGFDSLIHAGTLPALAERFASLLRRHLRFACVDIWFKAAEDLPWVTLSVDSESCFDKEDPFRDCTMESSAALRAPCRELSFSFAVEEETCFGIIARRDTADESLDQGDILALQMFLQTLSNAYQVFITRQQEKEATFSLNTRRLQINSLVDAGVDLFAARDENTLLALALQQAAALTSAASGRLTVSRDGQVFKTYHFPESGPPTENPPSPNQLKSDFEFLGDTFTFLLFDKESRNGTATFDETDQVLLTGQSRQVKVTMENRYLYRQSMEQERLRQELAVAASIQRALMPTTFPRISGYEIDGFSRPCKEVGGDFFHCIPMENGRQALVTGDVSGKGIPAALLVSTLHAALHAYLDSQLSLAEIGRKINSFIYESSTENKYITCFIGILTSATGELEVLNAGHESALLRRPDGSIDEIRSSGLPLGIFEDNPDLQPERLRLVAGDTLLVFTDGLPDAQNESGETYGLPRVLEQLRAPATAGELVRRIHKDVQRFTGHAPLTDDLTLLAAICTQPCPAATGDYYSI
ncbi:MAG: PP2C family protein-serine/threonine phosphatase [Acidobacteria bacterium]|nr:PP2C family protein-serine/threonine phosphatase [Acidobacteriota bacterium]